MELSLRETEIIIHIANGFSDKEIATKLNISSRTIQTYVVRICLKLNARNRVHAVTKLFLKKLNVVTSPII
jgi:DNA-binding NarL/FixJ family response regulator